MRGRRPTGEGWFQSLIPAVCGRRSGKRHATAHDETGVEERSRRHDIDERRLDEHRHGSPGKDDAREFAHHRRPQAGRDRPDVAQALGARAFEPILRPDDLPLRHGLFLRLSLLLVQPERQPDPSAARPARRSTSRARRSIANPGSGLRSMATPARRCAHRSDCISRRGMGADRRCVATLPSAAKAMNDEGPSEPPPRPRFRRLRRPTSRSSSTLARTSRNPRRSLAGLRPGRRRARVRRRKPVEAQFRSGASTARPCRSPLRELRSPSTTSLVLMGQFTSAGALIRGSLSGCGANEKLPKGQLIVSQLRYICVPEGPDPMTSALPCGTSAGTTGSRPSGGTAVECRADDLRCGAHPVDSRGEGGRCCPAGLGRP